MCCIRVIRWSFSIEGRGGRLQALGTGIYKFIPISYWGGWGALHPLFMAGGGHAKAIWTTSLLIIHTASQKHLNHSIQCEWWTKRTDSTLHICVFRCNSPAGNNSTVAFLTVDVVSERDHSILHNSMSLSPHLEGGHIFFVFRVLNHIIILEGILTIEVFFVLMGKLFLLQK